MDIAAARPSRAGLCALLLAVVAPGPVAAAPPCAGHSSGEVPRALLERAPPLRTGIGKAHEAVTTASAEARAFYDQGLAQLHSYEWLDSARAFLHALRLDPKLAMAWLGLSHASTGLGDDARAVEAFERARALAAGAAGWEQRRIAVREQQLAADADPDDEALKAAYRRALDGALAEGPDDPELWLLRGHLELPVEVAAAAHPPARNGSFIAFYEAALARRQDFFPAHHYLVHGLEEVGRTEAALQHAEEYVRLAPEVPHAHHMLGHDLRRLGRVEEAIAQFRRARELELARYRADGIAPQYDWHHAHNLGLLARSHEQLGQLALAEATFREILALAADSEERALPRREWPAFLLDRGRAGEALQAARELAKLPWPTLQALGHALAGQALVQLGRLREAQRELNGARSAARDRAAKELTSLDIDTLRGELLLFGAQKAAGARLLRAVADRARREPGPDAWSRALFRLEAIAAAARAASDWSLAADAARLMIEHDPHCGGGHFALALALDHQGDAAGARQALAAARSRWSAADAELRGRASR